MSNPLSLTLENVGEIRERVREMEERASARSPRFIKPSNPYHCRRPRPPVESRSRRRRQRARPENGGRIIGEAGLPREGRSPSSPQPGSVPAPWGQLWAEHGFLMPQPGRENAQNRKSVAQVAGVDSCGGTGYFEKRHSVVNKRDAFLRSIASESTMRELEHVTSFTPSDLLLMRRQFLEVAVSKSLNPEMFQEFLIDRFPQLFGHNALLLRLFTHFDANDDGEISFEEFILGLSKTIDCSTEEKIEMLFSCLDLSNDDAVSVSELMMFFSRNSGDLKEHYRFASDFVSTLDADSNGSVSLSEFNAALRENQMLLHCFAKMLPFPSMCEAPVRDLSVLGVKALSPKEPSDNDGDAGKPAFDFNHLKSLWTELVAPNGKLHGHAQHMNRKELGREAFMQLMKDFFGCTSGKQQELAERIFVSFDDDGNGTISLGELLRGLSVLLAPSEQQLVEFYFKLFDRDNNGKIDERELSYMLEHVIVLHGGPCRITAQKRNQSTAHVR